MPTLDILWYESLTGEPRIVPSPEPDEDLSPEQRRADSDRQGADQPADMPNRHFRLRARRAKHLIQ